MSDYKTTRVTLSGRISGHIWMPNALCWKPFTVEIERGEEHYYANGPVPDLETAFDRATSDGDFQDVSIDYALLEVERTKPGGYIHRRVVTVNPGDYASSQEQVDEVEMGMSDQEGE